MERIISKLISVLVATLLCAAAVTTASSQEQTKIDADALAARGEALANQDPLAVELRNQQPGDPARRGFDIGMGVAEGHTLPGPGKDGICASLSADEPRGCSIAVSFSVERNRNAVLASRGAAIAKADPDVAAARNATSDVFYKLGFDIGLAAAEGQTQPGPGKDRLRDSLLPALRGGFSDAVSFTLERNRNDAALGASSGTTAGPAEKAASNEIRCRGGRDRLIFTPENSKLGSTGETIIITLLTFEPGPNAAGPRGEGLRPGECSWVDRPLNGRFLIRFETPANAQLKQKLHGSQVDTSPTAAETYPDARTIPVYMNDPNHYWSFFGATPVNNFLTATGHSYWKPAISVGDVNRSPTEPARPKGRVLFPPKP